MRSSAQPLPAPASAAAAARSTSRRPEVRGFAVRGVLPYPADVGLERLHELVDAHLELSRILEEHEVQAPQRLGHRAIVDAPTDDRREPLIQRSRIRDFLSANLRADRLGTEREDDGIGLADQAFDALPPILEGVDFGAIDQRLEAAGLKRGLELIHESQILARIRDEDFGLGLDSNVRPSRYGGHGMCPLFARGTVIVNELFGPLK
jgi:hypothetical protein